MYKIIYPETEEEVVSIQFHEAYEAATYWKNSHQNMWIIIEPQHPSDKVAFMQIVTGEIIVVREFEGE